MIAKCTRCDKYASCPDCGSDDAVVYPVYDALVAALYMVMEDCCVWRELATEQRKQIGDALALTLEEGE